MMCRVPPYCSLVKLQEFVNAERRRETGQKSTLELFKIGIAIVVFFVQSDAMRLCLSLFLGFMGCVGLWETLQLKKLERADIFFYSEVDDDAVNCAISEAKNDATGHDEEFGIPPAADAAQEDRMDDAHAFGDEELSLKLGSLTLTNRLYSYEDETDDENMHLLKGEEVAGPLIFEDQMIRYFQYKMRLSPAQYCYVRCLQEQDRIVFIRAYVDALATGCKNIARRKEIIDSGGIRLRVWKFLMNKCSSDLHTTYHLHRYAHWGENAGAVKVSKYYSSYTVELAIFGPLERTGGAHILYHDHHLERVQERLIKPSRHVNSVVDVDEEIADVANSALGPLALNMAGFCKKFNDRTKGYDKDILLPVIKLYAASNIPLFHRKDGAGYEFIAQAVVKLDAINPQVAARLAGSFGGYKKLDQARREKVENLLRELQSQHKLSPDTFEIVSRFLN
eukprot:gene2861-3125_t